MGGPATSGHLEPWGKANRNCGTFHHLAHHMADVAACFESICQLPVIRDRLEKAAQRALNSQDIARLAALTFLHDAGKLHPGFQAKGWPQGQWRGGLYGHVKEGAALFAMPLLEPLAVALGIGHLIGWGVTRDLLHASFAHHGRPFMLGGDNDVAGSGWFEACSNGYDLRGATAEIGALLPLWFPDAFVAGGSPLPDGTDFQHLFCGLVSLADWLGSDQRIFEFSTDLDSAYIERARQNAATAVAGIRLDTRDLQRLMAGRTGFSDLTGFAAPNGQQAIIGNAPLAEPLLIFEAETGSGKTEAALWRFAKLLEAGLVDSLYFAVPTRAAAKQLHRRVHDAMIRLFGEYAPDTVLAVPGYMLAGETGGRMLPGFQVLWDDDPDRDRLLARWSAENAKRYLAAPVAVGTVDQAMLGALTVKHAHLRAASLCRSLLVIDEVHASDRYMREVQHRLLTTHLSRGGHALLMSATLGSVARGKWLGQSQPSFAVAVEAPYPALWSRGETGPRSTQATPRQKTVTMRSVSTMDASRAAESAVEAAGRGARVLVIRNTVDMAIATWQAVRDMGRETLLMGVAGGPALHHSRFAPEDRRLLDKAVEETLHTSIRLPGGVIVIGSQTLEQSLDIDADLLITDLCPVDVLLQRIGRLHRHSLPRPSGFEKPACHVLLPEKGLEPLLKPAFENGLGGWLTQSGGLEGVYRDLAILELTRRLIEEHPAWEIPAMNRFLVESATHPDCIEALIEAAGPPWRNYQTKILGKDLAEVSAAKNVLLDTRIEFANLKFSDDEEKIRTRLGEEGAAITLAAPVVGPFGQSISGFTLPAHWSPGLQRDEVPRVDREGDRLLIQVGNVNLQYSREGLKQKVAVVTYKL